MKKLILLILLIPSILFAGPLQQAHKKVIAGQTVAGGDAGGFVGTKNGTLQTSDTSSADRRGYFSEFSNAISGDVSYIYLNIDVDLSSVDIRPAIWDLTLTGNAKLLVAANGCSPTLVSGTLYRYTLSSSYTLSSGTTYALGFVKGNTSTGVNDVSSTSGATELGTFFYWNECPVSTRDEFQNQTDEGDLDANYTLAIWASNSSSDTHE